MAREQRDRTGLRRLLREPAGEARIPVDDDARVSRFSELAENAPPTSPAEVGEEDTAMILYTSGTTGKPKGAMLAHCNVIHSAMVFVSCLQLTAADRSIAAVPLGHVTGVVANIMTMVRCAGALIIMPEFKAAEYLKLAARERVTYTVMVPAMYNLCLLQPDFDSYDLSSWRIGGFGGAPMPIATIEKLAPRFPGLKLANCYGATETTSPSTMMPGELTASHIDSVGLPCPGAQIIVVDADGRELPRGEIGEIWIHGGSVIKGYWNNPKATAESFTGGFWHSGDLGSIDAENFVRVFDRQKDMINRGGLKIYSAEVESVLSGHPDVVESAIIAKPCPVLGERVHAVVVTRNAVGGEALRAWCAERLSDYKVPETMDLTTEPLPRNANGKVMKRQLREAWAAATAAQSDDRRGYSFGALPFGIALLVLFGGKRLAVDRGRADDAFDVQQRELRDADAVRRACPGSVARSARPRNWRPWPRPAWRPASFALACARLTTATQLPRTVSPLSLTAAFGSSGLSIASSAVASLYLPPTETIEPPR